MNYANLVGVISGVLFLALAIGFSADNPLVFINIPGLLIVLGGTITAILVSHPYREVIAALKQAKVVTEPLELELREDIDRICLYSKLWFRKMYTRIDDQIEKEHDEYLQRGLQMVRDQQSLDEIISALNWKVSQFRSRELGVINVFRAMATYAPAFGMVGSLVGLVNMLQDVESGALASMTSDMAIALVTTFYGLLLANLVCKPVATKLEQRRNLRIVQMSLLAEGISMIAQHKTPASIRDSLMGYVQNQEVKTTKTSSSNGLRPAVSA